MRSVIGPAPGDPDQEPICRLLINRQFRRDHLKQTKQNENKERNSMINMLNRSIWSMRLRKAKSIMLASLIAGVALA